MPKNLLHRSKCRASFKWTISPELILFYGKTHFYLIKMSLFFCYFFNFLPRNMFKIEEFTRFSEFSPLFCNKPFQSSRFWLHFLLYLNPSLNIVDCRIDKTHKMEKNRKKCWLRNTLNLFMKIQLITSIIQKNLPIPFTRKCYSRNSCDFISILQQNYTENRILWNSTTFVCAWSSSCEQNGWNPLWKISSNQNKKKRICDSNCASFFSFKLSCEYVWQREGNKEAVWAIEKSIKIVLF